MSGPIASLTFTVLDPVGINEKLKRGRGRRLYVSAEAVAFGKRVETAAMIARAHCREWPRNPYICAAVTLTIQIYNTAHDAEACEKPVADKLQRILYANDRIVSYGPKSPPIKDDGPRRVEVRAELWAVIDEKAAEKKEAAADRRKALRLSKPRARRVKKSRAA